MITKASLGHPPISTPPHPPLPTHQGCAVIFPCRVLPPSEWRRTFKYSTAPHLRFLPVPSCPLLNAFCHRESSALRKHATGWESLSKQLAILYQSPTVSPALVPSSPSFNYTGSSKSFPGPKITSALCPPVVTLQVLWDTV